MPVELSMSSSREFAQRLTKTHALGDIETQEKLEDNLHSYTFSGGYTANIWKDVNDGFKFTMYSPEDLAA